MHSNKYSKWSREVNQKHSVAPTIAQEMPKGTNNVSTSGATETPMAATTGEAVSRSNSYGPSSRIQSASAILLANNRQEIPDFLVGKVKPLPDLAEQVLLALEFYARRHDGGKARDVLQRLYKERGI